MECTLIFGFGFYPPRLTYEIPSKLCPGFPPIFVPCATKFHSFISLQHKMSESESFISLQHKMSDDSDSDFGFGSSSPLLHDEDSTTTQELVVEDEHEQEQQEQEDIQAVIIGDDDKHNE